MSSSAVQYPQASKTFPVSQDFLRSTVGPHRRSIETARERGERVTHLIGKWSVRGAGANSVEAQKKPLWEETDFVGSYHTDKVPTNFPIPGHAVRHEARRSALRRAAKATFDEVAAVNQERRMRDVLVKKTKDISVYNFYFNSTLRLVDMGEDLLDQTQRAVEDVTGVRVVGKLNMAAAERVSSGKKRVVSQRDAEERILREEAARTLEGGDPLAALEEHLLGKRDKGDDPYAVTAKKKKKKALPSGGSKAGASRPGTGTSARLGAGFSARSKAPRLVEGIAARRKARALRVVEDAQRICPLAVTDLPKPDDDSVGYRIHHLAALRMKMLEAERSKAARRFEASEADERRRKL